MSALRGSSPQAAQAAIADIDLKLKKLTEQAIAKGLERKTVVRLLIDHAFDILNASPGHARESASLILDEALRLHSIYDDPDKAT